ncbi:uncharacterized protein LOC143265510 [Megachile rotundata]|uniref:uncharacterized protein LOC143265510 n=1 Tax=Megachile rotundata TaxID=143995 RepID=UPI003FD05EA1
MMVLADYQWHNQQDSSNFLAITVLSAASKVSTYNKASIGVAHSPLVANTSTIRLFFTVPVSRGGDEDQFEEDQRCTVAYRVDQASGDVANNMLREQARYSRYQPLAREHVRRERRTEGRIVETGAAIPLTIDEDRGTANAIQEPSGVRVRSIDYSAQPQRLTGFDGEAYDTGVSQPLTYI